MLRTTEETPKPSETTPTKAKVEIPPMRALPTHAASDSDGEKKSREDDGICRVSRQEKGLRNRIGYCLNRLGNGYPVTLQAYGLAVNKAILISSIVRTKLGDVH